MKLLTQATLYYLLVTLLVFGLGGVLTYNIFQSNINQETDWHLGRELRRTYKEIEKGAPIHALEHKHLRIKEIADPSIGEQQSSFQDTLIWHRYSKKEEPFRKVQVRKEIDGKLYQITLIDLIVETQDVYNSVFRSLSWMFALLVVIVGIFSFFISRWLFRPFNHTLRQIKQFRVQDQPRLDLGKTFTKEFSQLNAFISQMTEKAQQDYLNLKEFSENASHEMQTPIAIAKGKLELLLENNSLSEEQSQLVFSAYNALGKLSKLGRSLALLTRIENQEFSDYRLIHFSELLTDALFNFQELMELKEIRLHQSIVSDVYIHIDPILADMMLTNLFQNAIRHNVKQGVIDLYLENDHLLIRNSGEEPRVAPHNLFKRFQKNPSSNESLGLGLAIVQKICEVSNLQIDFRYRDAYYEMEIRW
ncbi:MAG: HAMP domain-containing sensor histidine kinase [Bacteroidota bacterium]